MRFSNPANRESITPGSVLYKKMSVWSDLELQRAPALREALGRFKQARLGSATGSGSRFGAQKAARADQFNRIMSLLDAANGVKSTFAPVQDADEPIGLSLAFEGLRSSAANGSGQGAAYCESSAIWLANQSRSCFHRTLSGDRAVRRTMIAWPCRNDCNASARFPNSLSTLAIFECDTAT
jgi:hypothetical protein